MDHVLRLRGVRHYLVILIILLLHYMLSKEELLEAVTVNSKVTLEQMDTMAEVSEGRSFRTTR